jgi:DNA-binding LacI/PurR family transcriptional regulator
MSQVKLNALDFSEPFAPRITTMRLDTDLTGRLSGELILDRLKGAAPRLHVLKMRETLQERGSRLPLPAAGGQS